MLCGILTTESGNRLLTESGVDFLVTECLPFPFVNAPGRTYPGAYPYYKKPKSKWPTEEIEEEEARELLILICIMLGILKFI